MGGFDAMSQAAPGQIINGEHLLLGGQPERGILPAYFSKKRYVWDGEPEYIGCAIGCEFCYYRWIDTTADTIGKGRQGLRRIGDPQGAVQFLQDSRLFTPDEDVVLLCARSDGSMQVESLAQFLTAFPYRNLVLILHRGYFGPRQLEAWGSDERAISCTTLTPSGPDLAWTPIQVERQLQGIQFLLQNGVPTHRISVMLGPINRNNVDADVVLMEQLADLGFGFLTYRGCSVGNFGVAPDNQGLRDIGFLDGGQDEHAAPGGHDYYTMKNWLAPEVEEQILAAGERLGLRLYRHTGKLYRDEYGVAVAYNRNNRWRRSLGAFGEADPAAIQDAVTALGFHPLHVDRTDEGYLVTLPDAEYATEDVAMTVGARFRTCVIFNNHRIAPTLDDLRFYAQNHLMPVSPQIDALVR